MATNTSKIVSDYNRALATVTKKDDRIEESAMLLAAQVNWGSFLQPSPLAICLLGQLQIIACAADFSLEDSAPKDGFKYIKYPVSFRASLVQVSNEGWKAFNQAHNNMSQIAMYSDLIPAKVSDALNLLVKGTALEINIQLPKILKSISNSADACKELALQTEASFIGMMDLTGELLEVSTLRKGVTEKAQRETEMTLRIKEQQKKYAEEEAKRCENIYEEMKKSLNKSQELFEKAAQNQPSNMAILGLNVVESLSNKFSSFIDIGITIISRGNPKINPSSFQPLESNTTAPKLPIPVKENFDDAYSSADEILAAVTTLCVINDKGKADLTKLRDNSEGALWVATLLKALKENIRSTTPAGKNAINICNTGIKIATELENLTNSLNPEEKKVAAVMKSANDLVMKAKSFHAEAFFQQKSAATQGRGPAVFNAAKSVSDLTASSNAAQMVMKNWQYKVELSKERLKTAREDFKIASEELAKSGEKNVNLLTEMASLNLNNIDYDRIRKVLQQAIQALGELREQWAKLVQFFQFISNIIKVALNDTVKRLVGTYETTLELGGVKLSQYMQDTLYAQTMNAHKISYLVNTISTTYVQISDKYIMDRLAKLQQLIALDPATQSAQIHRARLELNQGCSDAQDGIANIMRQWRNDFEDSISDRMDTVSMTLCKALPPPDPEEQGTTIKLIHEASEVIKNTEKRDESDDNLFT